MNFPRIRAAMLSSRCLKRAGAAWFLSVSYTHLQARISRPVSSV